MSVWQNIWAVIHRELHIIRNHPIYLNGSVGVMLVCTVFYLTFFKAGLPQDLPIGVIDADNSSTSREFVRQLDATQAGKTIMFQSYDEARLEMMRGNITGICVIPEHFNDDIQTFKQPTFTFYVNSLYYVSGSLTYKNILTMINLTNGAVQRQMLRAKGYNDAAIMGMIQPVTLDMHQIGNVYTNYGYYLSNIMLPGCLQMCVIIILIYSLGMELKYETSRYALTTAGKSMITLLAGKTFVYTVLFTVIGILMILSMYWLGHFPIAGSIWNMMLAVLLLVVASESVAIFIIGCLPVPRLALSIGALYSVLGFSFSGFTLPVEAMPSWIQGLSRCFPLRHYYLFYVQETIFGSGFPGWYRSVIALLLFVLVPCFVIVRLKKAFIHQNFPKE